MRPHVLVISDSDLGAEPRVLMEIEAFAGFCQVTAAGVAYTGFTGSEDVRFVSLPLPPSASRVFGRRLERKIRHTFRRLRDSLLRRLAPDALMLRRAFREESAAWLRALRDVPADIIIAHHAVNLPIAIRLAREKSIPVIFNAHEYYPRQFDGDPLWEENVKPVAEFICRTFMPRADAVLTVCQGIADEYRKQFGVNATVLMSTKPFHDLRPGPVDPACIRLIHHGIANPNRQIENMIGLIDLLDERFRIDFMLVPSRSHRQYYEDLCRRIDAHPRLARVAPLPTARIVTHINQYDLGLFFLVPLNFNLLHFLPNKFFEFVQARLGVAFTPIPEVSPLVRRFGLGVLSEDFTVESMARAINSLTAGRVEELKQAADAAARELSSQRSYELLRDTVNGLLPPRLRAAAR